MGIYQISCIGQIWSQVYLTKNTHVKMFIKLIWQVCSPPRYLHLHRHHPRKNRIFQQTHYIIQIRKHRINKAPHKEHNPKKQIPLKPNPTRRPFNLKKTYLISHRYLQSSHKLRYIKFRYNDWIISIVK